MAVLWVSLWMGREYTFSTLILPVSDRHRFLRREVKAMSCAARIQEEGGLRHQSENHQMDAKSPLNVILTQTDILSNRSRPQKREDPQRGNEVNPGWLKMGGRNNNKEVVLATKVKATAGPPQFHDSRKKGSQKVVSVRWVSRIALKMT